MKNKKGFSFVELLTTVAILSILSLISVVSYKRYKKNAKETWVKVELGKVAQHMKSARFLDNGYHQFLYMVGYRPKGRQEGFVALPSQTTGGKACCDNYPDIGSSPCVGGFMYYNCQNLAPHNKSSNLEICTSSPNCTNNPSLSVNHTNPLGGGTAKADCNAQELDSNSNSWCDCDNFTLVGVTSVDSFFTLNNRDFLCYKKQASGTLEVVK